MSRSSLRPDRWLLGLLPALAVLLIVFGLPLADLASVSVHLSSGPAQIGSELTPRNYILFFSDPFFLGIMIRTLALGLVVALGCLLLAFPVAYLLARTPSGWRGLVLLVVAACMLVSSVVRNLGWFPILGETGLVNWIFSPLAW